jgi:hypothetical protein
MLRVNPDSPARLRSFSKFHIQNAGFADKPTNEVNDTRIGSFVSVTRRTTVRDSVNVVDDFYDIYG